MDREFDPFFGQAPERISLPNAPLVCVLSQVRFDEILAISKREFLSDFHEAIRGAYPILKSNSNIVFRFDGGAPEATSIANWQFMDGERNWRVTLSTGFLTLECRAYTTREEFVARYRTLLEALEKHIRPGFLKRIGVRYVDRVSGQQYRDLHLLIRREIAGFAGSQLRARVIQSVHETLCQVKEGKLLARWGMIPKESTHDPSVLPPIAEDSWMLDLDVFSEFAEAEVSFTADAVANLASEAANRAYAVFRWAVEDEFIRAYGGKV